MLSISSVGSAGGAANYYTSEDNYYFLGEQSTEWFGKGAEKLALSGAVDRADFKDVLEGKLPDGGDLTHMRDGKNTHQAGYDLTFSAPKSVSILTLVAGDKDLLEAHKEAVRKTLGEIESLISTRTMIDGVPIQTPTQNMVGALFMHDTSRNLDPQLHTHAIVANATFDENTGKWKTLSSDKVNGVNFVETDAFTNTLFKEKKAFGTIYRQFLKEEVLKQGYEIELVGRDNLWEIKGVPEELLKSFSTRRQEILEASEPNASAKSLSITTKETRKVKDLDNVDMGKLHQEWKEKLDKTGFSVESIKHQRGDITQIKDPLPTSSNAKEAVAYAIEKLEKTMPKFSHSEIMSKAVSVAKQTEGYYAEIYAEVKSAISSGQLIVSDSKHSIYTTAKHLENERDVVKLITQLKTHVSGLTKSADTIIGNHLVDEQSRFSLFTVQGSNQYEAKLLSDVQKVAEANQREHIIITKDRGTKYALLETTGKQGEVYTLNEYLDDKAVAQGRIVSVYQAEKMTLTQMRSIMDKSLTQGDTLAVLDMGGKRNAGLTRDLAENIGIERITLTQAGDKRQLTIVDNVDKGDQMHAAIGTFVSMLAKGEDTVLQTNAARRTEITNRVRESLKEYGYLSDRGVTVKSRESVFVADYQDKRTYKEGYLLQKKGSDDVLRIVGINKTKNTLILNNAEGQQKSENIILPLSKLNSSYLVYKETDLELKVGEKVTTTALGYLEDKKIGMKLTVVGVQKHDKTGQTQLVLSDNQGKSYELNTDKVAYLAYDYAEAHGKSRNGSRDSIVALVSRQDMNKGTISEIQKGAGNVVVITSLDSKQAQEKLNLTDTKVTVTDSLTSIYNAKDIKVIQQESIKKEGSELARIVNNHIEKAMLETKDKVSFKPADVVTSVTAATEYTRKDVSNYLISRIEAGDIISLGGNGISFNEMHIPKTGLETEKAILDLVERTKGSMEPFVKITTAFSSFRHETKGLTFGQKELVRMSLMSEDAVNTVQGLAGVGKTHAIRTAIELAQFYNDKIEFKALAPTLAAVDALKGAGVKEAATYQSFLSNLEQNPPEKQTYKNQIYLVDESSMLGNTDLHKTMQAIVEHGGKIIFIGDKNQLKSIASGTPFAALDVRGKQDKVTMTDIVRQKPHLRPAVELAVEDKVPHSLARIDRLSPHIVPRQTQDGIPTQSVLDFNSERKLDVLREMKWVVENTQDTRKPLIAQTKTYSELNATVNSRLTQGQKTYVEQVLMSKNAVNANRSDVGIGRDNAVRSLLNLAPLYDSRIQIRALSSEKGLEAFKQMGVETATYTQFLADKPSENAYQHQIFLIDEKNMLGNKALLDSMQQIVKHGGRVEFLGNHLQHLSQVEAKSEQTAYNLKQSIVDDFFSRTPEAQKETLIALRTNKEVMEVNNAIHDGYVKQGVVTDSIQVPFLHQKNTTEADLRSPAVWTEERGNVAKINERYYRIGLTDNKGNIQLKALDAEGKEVVMNSYHINTDRTAIYERHEMRVGINDEIRFTSTDRERMVQNNSSGRVVGIDDNKLFIESQGKVLTYDPLGDVADQHISLNYASTVYRLQGATGRFVIGGFTEEAKGRELDYFYVVISRAVEHVQIISEDVGKLVGDIWQTGRGDRATTLDLYEGKEQATKDALMSTLLVKERAEWEQAIPLSHLSGIRELGLPDSMIETSRYSTANSELLYQVKNEEGQYRGNLHIPFEDGSLKLEKAYSAVAEDGKIIVLNQGNEQNGVQEFNATQLNEALYASDDTQRVIIKLEAKEQEDITLLMEQKQAVGGLEDEIREVLKGGEVNEDIEASPTIAQLLDEHIEQEVAQELSQEQETERFDKLGNDEVNILKHDSEPTTDNKIQEKELV